MLDDRRARVEADRRTGFDRRSSNMGRAEDERRRKRDRRLGPRRLRDRPGEVDLVAAARRAREHADAAYSHFKVGAALEAADGTVITGCNIENATFGLTTCAERVAMFKALSEGHRAFTRIAIVADTDKPTPPCGACRQILWEFGGNLEILLANLEVAQGTHRLKDLLPLPFDARLL
jgi:cytidine deaminase